MACFSNRNISESLYRNLSDNGLFLVCHKIKRDPIFDTLDYLQNRFKAESEQTIQIVFKPSQDEKLTRLAIDSLSGFVEEG